MILNGASKCPAEAESYALPLAEGSNSCETTGSPPESVHSFGAMQGGAAHVTRTGGGSGRLRLRLWRWRRSCRIRLNDTASALTGRLHHSVSNVYGKTVEDAAFFLGFRFRGRDIPCPRYDFSVVREREVGSVLALLNFSGIS